MGKADGVRVSGTCECGSKLEIPIAGEDLETFEFTCPACGKSDRFTPEQIATFREGHELLAKAVRDALR